MSVLQSISSKSVWLVQFNLQEIHVTCFSAMEEINKGMMSPKHLPMSLLQKWKRSQMIMGSKTQRGSFISYYTYLNLLIMSTLIDIIFQERFWHFLNGSQMKSVALPLKSDLHRLHLKAMVVAVWWVLCFNCFCTAFTKKCIQESLCTLLYVEIQ